MLLIKRLGQWNGYHMIIFSLTIGQILYDVNYMLGVVPGAIACKAWQFLDVVGGLSTTIWSNILGGCVLHIAMKIKSANISRNFPKFFAVAVIFPAFIALLQIALDVISFDESDDSCEYKDNEEGYAVRGLYYWSRIASIIMNVIIYISITVKINNMVETSKGGKYEALTELAARMKYYPLFQALSRSGAAWDEFNRAGDSGYFPSSLMRSICSPSSGIWYFLIFVVMQPGVLGIVKSMIRDDFCCCLTSVARSAEHSFNAFGSLAGIRVSTQSASSRVSLTGSVMRSDDHSRRIYKSNGDSLVMCTTENEEGIFGGDSVGHAYGNIDELDEDDLESLITSGNYTERTLSRHRSMSTTNTKSSGNK